MQAMEISRTALDVEWRRLEMIAENLANADVARAGKAPLYQSQSLVSGPKGDFASYLQKTDAASGEVDLTQLQGVAALGVNASNAPPHLVHEPGNPNADANGYVAYPAVDHVEQMTTMIKTTHAYDANIVAMNAAREMYSKALDLGRHS
jgi:flagellar basal-body rod protein FlgC